MSCTASGIRAVSAIALQRQGHFVHSDICRMDVICCLLRTYRTSSTALYFATHMHDVRVCCVGWHICLQVKSRQLWGEDIYTDDSDLVAVLLHLGYYASNNTASNPLVSRFYAQISLLPAQEQYHSCFRNAVRSRGWFSKIEGCSYKVCAGWVQTAELAAIVAVVTHFHHHQLSVLL